MSNMTRIFFTIFIIHNARLCKKLDASQISNFFPYTCRVKMDPETQAFFQKQQNCVFALYAVMTIPLCLLTCVYA